MKSSLIHKNLVRDIIKYGHENFNEILQRKINPQKNIDPENLRQQISMLKHTAAANGLISLSANQILLKNRIFVILKKNILKYGRWRQYDELFLSKRPEECYDVIVNPQLVSHSNFKIKSDEQCPSVEGLKFKVWVPLTNKMQFFKYHQSFQRNKKNPPFEKCSQSFTGFYGRVFDHQFRHLEGILPNLSQICNDEVYLTNQSKLNPQNYEFLKQYRLEKQFFNEQNMNKHMQREQKRLEQMKQGKSQAVVAPEKLNLSDISQKIGEDMRRKLTQSYKQATKSKNLQGNLKMSDNLNKIPKISELNNKQPKQNKKGNNKQQNRPNKGKIK